jgi:hypothetical protein
VHPLVTRQEEGPGQQRAGEDGEAAEERRRAVREAALLKIVGRADPPGEPAATSSSRPESR